MRFSRLRSFSLFLFIIGLVLYLSAPAFSLPQVYVSTSGFDTNSGADSGHPVLNIAKALKLIDANGTINLASGTYSTIETLVWPNINNITIEGNGSTVRINAWYKRIIDVPPTSSVKLTLRSLTLQDGYMIGTGNGVILIETAGCTLEMNNVYVTNNRANTAGGVICGTLSSGKYPRVILNNCSFYDNYANSGGVFYQVSLEAIDCQFSKSNAAAGNGGVLWDGVITNLTRCYFYDSHASNVGGCFYNAKIYNINNCLFRNSTAETWGGVSYYDTTGLPQTLVVNSTFEYNTAKANQGGCFYMANIKATNSVFRYNKCGLYGGVSAGVVAPGQGTFEAYNCVISYNKAAQYGGVIYGNKVSMEGCVLISNEATSNQGGVVRDSWGNITIRNCTFESNKSVDGAVFSNAGATATPHYITGSTFNKNIASNTGGVFQDCYVANITNCAFTMNKAINGVAAVGYNGNTVFNITNSSFISNEANYGGVAYGGLWNTKNCVFRNNRSTRTTLDNYGGGVAYSVTWNTDSCTYEGNSANSRGGVFNQCPVVATNCAFSRNTTTTTPNGDGYGGVDMNYPAYYTFKAYNCSFIGNTANRGGALSHAPFTLVNCIFVNNVATNDGGVINQGGSGQPTNAYNCTFYNNKAMLAACVNATGSFNGVNCIIWNNVSGPLAPFNITPTLRYSAIQPNGFVAGTGNTSKDVYFISTTEGNLDFMQLRAGSAGIDYGTMESGIPTKDAEGKKRPYGYGTDMGAYEFKGPSVRLLSPNGGQIYAEGNTIPITWIASSEIMPWPVSGNVSLEYSTDNGLNWLSVSPSYFPYTQTSYTWIAPSIASKKYLIRAFVVNSDPVYNYHYDDSDANFEVKTNTVVVSQIRGNDDPLYGDGSASKPFKTIQKGLDSVPAGGLVSVESGVYQGAGNVSLAWPSLNNITLKCFSADPATIDGQAVANTRAINIAASVNMTIEGILIKNFRCSTSGAGIMLKNGSMLWLNRVTMMNCTAESGGLAGAIYTPFTVNISSATIEARNCTFINNRSATSSGGVGIYQTWRIYNCVFLNNYSGNASTTYGGGVFSESKVYAENSLFDGNSTAGVGGVMSGGDLALTSFTGYNCVFKNNSSPTYYGGAIARTMDKVILANCLFFKNSATYGGCFYRTLNTIATNCAFVYNKATTQGGIYWDSVSTPFTATNCILWGNTGSSGSPAQGSTTTAYKYCDIQPDGPFVAGTGNLSVEPQFITTNETYADFLRLKCGSRCIDGGITETGVPSLDAANWPRPYGLAADMGPYEFHGPSIRLTFPNTKEVLLAGQTYNVTWLSSSESGFQSNPINIRYSFNNGVSWLPVATSLPNTVPVGSFAWTVPDVATSKLCLISIEALGNMNPWYNNDQSDVTFEVKLNVLWASPTGSDESGTGSREAPFRTIQKALNLLGPGGSVWLLKGVYTKEVWPIQWPATQNLELAADPAATGIATLDANWAGGVRCINITSAVNLTLEGITIQRFRTNAGNNGAAIGCNTVAGIPPNTKLWLNNVTINVCTADGSVAGGVACFDNTVQVNANNCRFLGNSAYWAGFYYQGTWNATNCIFRGNRAYWAYAGMTDIGGGVGALGVWNAVSCTFDANSAAYFGGAFDSPTTFVGSNCTFSNNTALNGGAIGRTVSYAGGYPSTWYIKDCLFTKNIASGTGANGYGGVFCAILTIGTDTFTATNCAFISNESQIGGVATFGKWNTKNCLFRNNRSLYSGTSSTWGGGIAFTSTWLTSNCTYDANSTGYLGGVFSLTNVIATNCAFSLNTAKEGGVSWTLPGSGGNLFTAEACSFTGNGAKETATGSGGGVFHNTRVNANNCSFIRNSSSSEGGVSWYSGDINYCYFNANNCLFANNRALLTGAVSRWGMFYFTNCTLYIDGFLASSPWFYGGKWNATNSIFWGSANIFRDSTEGWGQFLNNFKYCDIYWPGSSVTTKTLINCMDTEPYFVATNLENLKLQGRSPCLDAGTFEGATLTDINGLTRPLPTPEAGEDSPYYGYDMGCYEQSYNLPLVFVSNANGLDTNTGAINFPVKTIQKGLQRVLHGGTISVEAGTYKGAGNRGIRWPWRNNIYLKGAGIDKTILDGENFNTGSSYGIISSESGVSFTLEGISINNGNSAYGGGGIRLFPGNNLQLKSVKMYNNICGSSFCGGAISFDKSKIIAVNSIFSNNRLSGGGTNGGVIAVPYATSYGTLEAYNCIFNNNSSALGGGVAYNLSEVKAVNCTFINNSANSGTADIGYDGIWRLKNCILWGGSANIFSYAGIFADYCDSREDLSAFGVNNISVNPLFLSTAEGNSNFLVLQGNSKCIDTGVFASDVPSKDINGVSREASVTGRPDMGAIEWNGARKVHNETTNYAYPTIFAALDEVRTGETIGLEENIFYENVTNWPAYQDITIKSRGTSWESTYISGSNAGRVFDLSNLPSNIRGRIEGLTLTAGRTTEAGGAILFPQNSNMLVYNCKIINNVAGSGGGIANGSAESCVFVNNTAQTGMGGGAYNSKLYNCIFTNNLGVNGAGAALSSIESCTFSGNRATSGMGGAVYDCQVFRSTLSNNQALSGGGSANSSFLDSCNITGNTAANGSAIFASRESDSIFENCLVTGTGILIMKGISVDPFDMKFINSTISGGSIKIKHGTMTFLNSIIWGATISSDPGTMALADYSDVPVGVVGSNNLYNVDPRFYNSSGGNFRLRSDSPGIGVATIEGAPNYDLNGSLRLAPYDMGAYEYAEQSVSFVYPALSINNLEAGTTTLISWEVIDQSGNPSNTSYASLYYSIDSGTTWTTIDAEFTPNAGKNHIWNIPAIITSIYKVKITISNTPGTFISQTISNALSLVDTTYPTVTVESIIPTLGYVGSGYILSWEAWDTFPAPNPVYVEFSIDTGETWGPLPPPSTNLPMNWYYQYLPAPGTSYGQGTCKFRITVPDQNGNTTLVTTDAFGVDTKPPVLTVDVTTETTRRKINVTASATDENGVGVIRIRPGENAPILSTTESYISVEVTIVPGTSGTHNITVESRDTGGNLTWETRVVDLILSQTPEVMDILLDGHDTTDLKYMSKTPKVFSNVYDYQADLSAVYVTIVANKHTYTYLAITTESTDDITLYSASAETSIPDNSGTFKVIVEAVDVLGNIFTFESSTMTVTDTVKVTEKIKSIPNPFSPLKGDETRIIYKISNDADIKLLIYDLTGRPVWQRFYHAGENGGKGPYDDNVIYWNGKSDFGEVLPNGVYIYLITSGSKVLGKGQLVILD